MLQRSARFQYVLLALVALIALTHLVLGARRNFSSQAHGMYFARPPFQGGRQGAAINEVTPEAQAAGLRTRDTVLTINGHPYLSGSVLMNQVRRSRPGEPLAVSFRRPGESDVRTATVLLKPIHPGPRPLWSWVVLTVIAALSYFCLLTGLYVVFARPRSPHAWLILGILGSFNSLFVATSSLSGPLAPVAVFWSVLSQTAMPLCLMAFGIYFPERSIIDIRYPWIKWIFVVPILLLFPLDLLGEFGNLYDFSLSNWLIPYSISINTIETIFGILAISYFFVCLFSKIRTATGDARRRLRILYFGSSVGLIPFFVLVVISVIRKTDIGQGIPQWIVLTIVGILFLFPLTLAYVVIVQRAMDVSILIRQGTKYAFARRSIAVLAALLGLWMAFALRDYFATESGENRTADVIKIFGILLLFFAFRVLLSKRLQQRIDQRFFREAYSAEQILSELSEEARNFTEVNPLLTAITQRIGDTLHVERIAVFLRAGDSYRLQFATGMPATPMMSPQFGSLALAASSATITNLARGPAPAPVYREDPSSWLVDATEAERNALNDLSTELLVPLPGRNRLAGVIALGPKRSEEPYSRSDRQLLQSVATQAGLALENAELFENLSTEIAQRERVSREIEIAREVQERLFPQSCPDVDGIDLAGYCRPAQVVGGDYYDYFVLPARDSMCGTRLALALGDISGKGISAALLMASLRASLRSAAQLQAGDLAALMEHVNRLVYDSSTANRYATFFYAEFDPCTRMLSYVNAGHNPPILLRGDQSILLEATGTVIGLLPEVSYAEASLLLHPGDVLITFTDGVSEAMDAEEREWGEDQMIAAVRTLLDRPECTATAQQLIDCVLEAADRFTAGAPQHDDMTLLVARIR